MNEFYVSMIFIGIVLVSVSLILIMLDKKKAFSFIHNYEKKKQELMEIIYDAEQMIEELSKFSDYVVTQMDFKNEELRINLKKAQEEIQALTKGLVLKNIHQTGTEAEASSLQEIPEVRENEPVVPEPMAKEKSANAPARMNKSYAKHDVSVGTENIIQDKARDVLQEYSGTNEKREKEIPANSKYSEVVRLFKAGMDNTDIAKQMNMGKGEVQLILELNK